MSRELLSYVPQINNSKTNNPIDNNSQSRSLHFDGFNLTSLSQLSNYSSPFMVYKKSLIRERIQWIKSWSKLKQLHFAIKSNYHPEILKIFKSENCGLDIVSLGELKAGLDVGFKPSDFIFSGVGKSAHEIDFAIDQNIYQINVESAAELRRIEERAQKKSLILNNPKQAQKVSLGLRLNPVIDAGTHPYISTALKDSKFGISLEDLNECLDLIKKSKHLSLRCLSFHIGSQILDVRVFKEAIDKMKILFIEVKSQFPTLDRFDVGGGLGIDYKSNNMDLDFERWNELKKAYSDSLSGFDSDVLFEMGRFMVARSAVFISQVQYIKNKNMLVLDLGMNNNLRPALYQAHHHFYNLIQKSKEKSNFSIVGPICESSDIFHKSIDLHQVNELDFLVMADCGAYVRSMASHYNLKPMAEEIFID